MKRRKFSLLILLLLIMGIGYATLSTNLSITGLNVFKGNTWDVHFENITDKSFNKTNDFTTAVLSQDRKSINFSVNLENPTESYIFYTDVVNGGTLDAMLDSVELEGFPEELENVITIQISYLDGAELNQYDLLRKNTRETIKVEAIYKDSAELEISDLPDQDYDFTLTLTMQYLQSDNNAVNRQQGEGDDVSPVMTAFDITPLEHAMNIQVTGYDEYSGIAKYYYSKDGGETFVSSSNPNYTFINLEDGDYDVVVYAQDLSGNVTPTSSKTFPLNTIYAILYTDGTLALNSTGNINTEKTVSKNYGYASKLKYEYYENTPWYNDRSQITTVDIETVIKPYNVKSWFLVHTNLTDVLHSSNLDMSNVTDMSLMFAGCSNLTNLDVSQWNTQNITTMQEAFSEVSKLTTLAVDNWNTSKVTNMYYLFNKMSALQSLNLSNWDVSKVTNMQRMFRNTTNLSYVNAQGWTFAENANVDELFESTPNLSTINVTGWDISKLTSLYRMFYNASKVATLDVANWDTSNIKNMDGLFCGASNLSTLNVSEWDTSSVENMSNMFFGTSKLQNPPVSSWDTSNVTNMTSMFERAGVTSLDLRAWDVSKVSNLSSMFQSSSVTSLNLSGWNLAGTTGIYLMFGNCPNLTSLNVTNWNTSNITVMRYLFCNITALEELDLTGWDTSNVTSMEGMFSSAAGYSDMNNIMSLKRIIGLDNLDTSHVTNMYKMFYNCNYLADIDLSKWDTRNVTNYTNMFQNTSKNATSHTIYYGPNSTSLFNNLSQSSDVYATLTFKQPSE